MMVYVGVFDVQMGPRNRFVGPRAAQLELVLQGRPGRISQLIGFFSCRDDGSNKGGSILKQSAFGPRVKLTASLLNPVCFFIL